MWATALRHGCDLTGETGIQYNNRYTVVVIFALARLVPFETMKKLM